MVSVCELALVQFHYKKNSWSKSSPFPSSPPPPTNPPLCFLSSCTGLNYGDTCSSNQTGVVAAVCGVIGFLFLALVAFLAVRRQKNTAKRTPRRRYSDVTSAPRALTRYVNLRVAHAPGMPGTFSPPLQVSDPDMHHGTRVTHVP